MDTAASFGNWLRKRRKALDLTQAELAERLGCALGTLRKWETGERRPSKQLARELVAVLHLPASQHSTFLQIARAHLPVDRLDSVDPSAPNRKPPEQASQANRLEEPVAGEAPFKGLRTYDVADAGIFFGREQLADDLVSSLRAGRHLLIVVGASGSGKSSLVRAGLVPTLVGSEPSTAHDLPVPGSLRWTVRIVTPTAHPLETLALSLTGEATSLAAAATLIDDMYRDRRSLHLAIRRLLTTSAGDSVEDTRERCLLLVVDQFEELFTQCRHEVERTAFIDNLLCAAAPETDGPTSIVLTLRADFYAHCAQFAGLRDALARCQTYIGPMSPDELRRAIEEPARRGGWTFEAGLVDLLLRDAGAEPGALPLLSHVLLETWRRRRGHSLTFAGYAEAGGLHGAIARTAERIYQAVPATTQTLMRRIFLQLTELGDGTQDTRRRVTLRELVAGPEEAATVEEVLHHLAEARLITTAEGTAEVAHEALIREWPTLREWLEEDREALRLQRRLEATAVEWAGAEQDPSFLASGTRLAQLETLSGATPVALSANAQSYLQASLAERDRRVDEEQERRATLAANLRRSEAQRLAAEAQMLLREGGQTELIALLAIRSIMNEYTPQGDAALAGAATLDYPTRIIAGCAPWGVAWSPDGRSILTGDGDGIARLWDAGTGQLVRLFAGHTDKLWRVTFSPDGDAVLAGRSDRTARLWETATGQELHSLSGHAGPVRGVAFSPDGLYILTGSDDRTARIWDATNGRELRSLTGHTALVSGVAFSPDGRLAATTSFDATVRLWDVASGTEVQCLLGHDAAVESVAFSPDGSMVLTCGADRTARLWDVVRGTELRRFIGHTDYIKSIAWMPNGRSVLTGSDDGTARLWDVATGKERHRFNAHFSFVFGVAVSPDGRCLVTGSGDGTARLWNIEPPARLASRLDHPDMIGSVACSPDGRYVLTAAADRIARLWDIQTGRPLRTFTGHTDQLRRAIFSPDGRYVLTAGIDWTARLWDTDTGAPLRTLLGHTDWVSVVVFSPDGKYVITGSDDTTARLWDAQTGALLHTFVGHTRQIFSAAISPDGTHLVTASVDGTTRLWDIRTGTERYVFPTGAASATFMPDGCAILTGDWNSRLRLWDLETGAELRRFDGHTATVWEIACSRDGRYILSGSGDHTARLWNVATGAELRRFVGHTGTVYGVAFSLDERYVFTGSADNTVRRWDIDYHTTIDDLCGRLLRDITEQERAQYGIADDGPTCPVAD